MDLSIVIPAYNERDKIARDVTDAASFLVDDKLDGEIIVVDDGSVDDTAVVARAVSVPAGVHYRVLRHERNRGKGFAVRCGMLETAGQFIMFADSGGCVPYSNAKRGISMIASGQCDIAHGSRKLPGSVIVHRRSVKRRLASWGFGVAARVILGVPSEFTDTQCGFKLYRGDIGRDLFRDSRTDGFAFDLDVMMRALHRGLVVREFPVAWSHDLDTRLRVSQHLGRVCKELLTIRREFNRA